MSKFLNQANLEVKRSFEGVERLPETGFSEIRHGGWMGREVSRLCIVLGGRGCTWYEAMGGCLMCNFPGKCRQPPESPRELGKRLLANFQLHAARHAQPCPIICIYNSGSFFDTGQVPRFARHEILTAAARLPHVVEIVTEARAEHLTSQEVEQAATLIAPKRLVVGIGLESASDFVRNRILLKGLPRDRFVRACQAVKGQASLLVYVLMGAPLLVENESIQDAIHSIQFAAAQGASAVGLQVCSVRPGTMLEWLWRTGHYRPPWLWSVESVLREVGRLIPIAVAGREGSPHVIRTGWNCDKCSRVVWPLLEQFIVTEEADQFELPGCECRQKWEAAVRESNPLSLTQRLALLEEEWMRHM